jgi:outer membrane biosynthesis protein TonB
MKMCHQDRNQSVSSNNQSNDRSLSLLRSYSTDGSYYHLHDKIPERWVRNKVEYRRQTIHQLRHIMSDTNQLQDFHQTMILDQPCGLTYASVKENMLGMLMMYSKHEYQTAHVKQQQLQQQQQQAVKQQEERQQDNPEEKPPIEDPIEDPNKEQVIDEQIDEQSEEPIDDEAEEDQSVEQLVEKPHEEEQETLKPYLFVLPPRSSTLPYVTKPERINSNNGPVEGMDLWDFVKNHSNKRHKNEDQDEDNTSITASFSSSSSATMLWE